MRFLYSKLRLLSSNNLVFFYILLPQLLPLGHLPARLDPLLLAHSHLLLLLSCVVLPICVLQICVRILVIHIVDVNVLRLRNSSFTVYMSITWYSLDLLDYELLRLAFVKISNTRV